VPLVFSYSIPRFPIQLKLLHSPEYLLLYLPFCLSGMGDYKNPPSHDIWPPPFLSIPTDFWRVSGKPVPFRTSRGRVRTFLIQRVVVSRSRCTCYPTYSLSCALAFWIGLTLAPVLRVILFVCGVQPPNALLLSPKGLKTHIFGFGRVFNICTFKFSSLHRCDTTLPSRPYFFRLGLEFPGMR